MPSDFISNEEIIQMARRRLHQGTWDYLVGGVESETTMRRNRLAFDQIAFRPRVLRDVSSVDPSSTFLGNKLRIPVLLAPVGSLQVFDPAGGIAATKAAAEFGVMHVVSSVTEPALEFCCKFFFLSFYDMKHQSSFITRWPIDQQCCQRIIWFNHELPLIRHDEVPMIGGYNQRAVSG